ncbi:insulinase family protein [Shimazuella sp. AN120528]|uniref:EF-P 5-aminopentanol modification-associated protein YfmF n=1 Tax=Shimazuella soli TaxID=1892854 RepID=UPI001F0EFBFB|nr:pitrilysin family protein [Shimazuella soli]MCH5586437.1 insulinase family protein [Shimazuella soli]
MSFATFQTVSLGNIRLHICPSDKFKTTTFSAFITNSLQSDSVTKNALLPNVLSRGTRSYPTTVALRQKFNELYGAGSFGDVFKRGERQVIQFGMDLANETYLQDAPSLLEEGIRLFCEIILDPFAENNQFHPAFVEAEKKNLKQRIDSLQDDKIRYAAERCVQTMCEGEPYSLYTYGNAEDIAAIDAKSLYDHYHEILDRSPIDLYCVGDVDSEEVKTLFAKYFDDKMQKATRAEVPFATVSHHVDKVKMAVDRLDVNQGKLNMGCRTQISIRDEAYPALLMYNGILGGFAHSKLFMNVREKESLAYYCSSSIESHKGLLFIQSGIEEKNLERAIEIIKEQLTVMKNGEITDRELEQTKATLSNQLREGQDRAFELIGFHFQSVLSGKSRTLEELLQKIDAITKEDIKKVAEQVELDTIYSLRGKEREKQ